MVSYLNIIHMSDNGKIRKYTEPKENEISDAEKKKHQWILETPCYSKKWQRINLKKDNQTKISRYATMPILASAICPH